MAVNSAKSVEASTYLHSYIRVGMSASAGPIFRVRRYDGARRLWTTENIHTGREDTISHDELTRAVNEGIIHVIGKVKADS